MTTVVKKKKKSIIFEVLKSSCHSLLMSIIGKEFEPAEPLLTGCGVFFSQCVI